MRDAAATPGRGPRFGCPRGRAFYAFSDAYHDDLVRDGGLDTIVKLACGPFRYQWVHRSCAMPHLVQIGAL